MNNSLKYIAFLCLIAITLFIMIYVIKELVVDIEIYEWLKDHKING